MLKLEYSTQFKKDFKNKTGVDLNDIQIHGDGPPQ